MLCVFSSESPCGHHSTVLRKTIHPEKSTKRFLWRKRRKSECIRFIRNRWWYLAMFCVSLLAYVSPCMSLLLVQRAGCCCMHMETVLSARDVLLLKGMSSDSESNHFNFIRFHVHHECHRCIVSFFQVCARLKFHLYWKICAHFVLVVYFGDRPTHSYR